MKSKIIKGHLAAITAVSIWGSTFIATKVLLRSFLPIEILVIRFILGTLALTIVSPRRMHLVDKKQEIYYVFAGLTGVTLYYLLENIALTYTFASNVGVIVSTAPFFTAIVVYLFSKERESLYAMFFLGFLVAFSGIVCISLNGAAFHLSPKGDFLTIGAALAWAFYSMILKKINSFGYSTVQNTRRIFCWGLLFMIPCACFMGFRPSVAKLMQPVNFLNFLFLGLGACALCFVIWNYAVKEIGPIRSSIYIYLDPVITVAVSSVILKEPVTRMMIIGTVLTIFGLLISELKSKKKENGGKTDEFK